MGSFGREPMLKGLGQQSSTRGSRPHPTPTPEGGRALSPEPPMGNGKQGYVHDRSGQWQSYT